MILFLLFPLQRTGNLRVLRTDIIMLLTDCLQPPDDTQERRDAQRPAAFICKEVRDRVTLTPQPELKT